MSKVWKTADVDASEAGRLSRETGLPEPLAAVLLARGYRDSFAIDRFLNPRLSDLSDPFDLPAMAPAVDRIWQALDQARPMVVYGDYDVDGITSTALLVRVLRRLGGTVSAFLPNRVDDGYGLSEDTLQRCVSSAKPALVITVDCGTSSSAAVRWAAGQGIDVVITDHHEPGGDVSPAVAVVNPKLGAREDLKNLAGVGVTFKLCHALIKKGRGQGRGVAKDVDLREYFDLVGVGTIADVVPLLGENRILAHHGLAALNKAPALGFRALIETAAIKPPLDSYHVGFLIGPRLNAAGRLGDAEASLELLLTGDESRAREIARRLNDANRERQAVEAAIVEEVRAELDRAFRPAEDFGLVLAREGWHPGVIGIVASRIVNRYRRPTVVIGIDEDGNGRGSCRSIEGFNLVEHLDRCADLLTKHGGHAMAAGLEVDEKNIEAFRARFNEVAAATLKGVDLRPVQKIDAWIRLGDADARMMEHLDRMRPFGEGNPAPIFGARAVRMIGQPRIVGKGHLKMLIGAGGTQCEAIGFNLAEKEVPDGPLDVAFLVQRNSYQGRETIQLNVKDLRKAEA